MSGGRWAGGCEVVAAKAAVADGSAGSGRGGDSDGGVAVASGGGGRSGAVAAAALEALVGRCGGGGGHGESGCGDGLVGGSDGGGRFSKNGRNMQMQQQRTWVDAIMPMKLQHVRGRERTLHPPSLSHLFTILPTYSRRVSLHYNPHNYNL